MKEEEVCKSTLLRIDHRNSLLSFNEDSLMLFKSNLYTQLLEMDSVDTNYVGTYLEKVYFNEEGVEKGGNFDFYLISLKLAKRVYNADREPNTEEILFSLNRNISNNSFSLNEKNISDISNLIAKIILNLPAIKNEKQFMEYLSQYKNKSKNYYIPDNSQVHSTSLSLSEESLNQDYERSNNLDESERRSTCESLKSSSSMSSNLNGKRISYYSKLNLINYDKKEDVFFYLNQFQRPKSNSTSASLKRNTKKLSDIFQTKENTYVNTKSTNFRLKLIHSFIKKQKNSEKQDDSKFMNELVTLVRILEIVKKIKISLPKISNKSDKEGKSQNTIYKYLLVLINLKWIFSSVLIIDMDLETELFKKKIGFNFEVDEDFPLNHSTNKNRFKKQQRRKSSKSLSKVNNSVNGKLENHSSNHLNEALNLQIPLQKLISDKKIIYELLMFLPYFLSSYIQSYPTITNLSLNIPDSYQLELDYLLKKEKILLSNFHLLDIIEMNTSLKSLELKFNSLDSNTFRRVISIIHNNNNLQDLKLDLFPDDEYFNSYLLSKIANLNEINLISVKGNYYYCSNYNTNISCLIDENENLLNSLLLQYQNNLEYFVYILSRKIHNLKNLKIKFDIPSMLFISDKYSNTFHKFLLNIFSMIEGGAGNKATLAPSTIESLEIYSKNFTFNSRSHPYIKEIIKSSRVKENLIVKNLVLDMKFNKINDILNLIPKNVQFLFLSEFDDLTFSSFIHGIDQNSTRKKNCDPNICENYGNFLQLENLNILQISLSHSLFNLTTDDKFNLILDFFKIKFTNNLKQIILNLNKLPVHEDNLGCLISTINKFSQLNPDISLYNLILSSPLIDSELIRRKEKRYKVLGHADKERLYPIIFSLKNFILKREDHRDEFNQKIITQSMSLTPAYTLIDLFLRKKCQKVIKLEFI
jgi:hypothetical protein